MGTALISRDIVRTTDMRLSVIEAPRPAIPTEVIEHIIDMVAELKDRLDRQGLEERTDSLYACTLVARSWVPRSRLHLFHLVELCSDRRTRRFLNLLGLSPTFGQYVKTLQIRPSDDNDGSCGWIYEALSALPPLLPNLRELAFCQLPDLRPECIAILSRFRTVESLELYNLQKQSLREVVQLINRFPQLRRLNVLHCGWELPGRCYSGKQHRLTSLLVNTSSLICDRSLLEWAVESGSTGALTTLLADSDVAGSAMDRGLQMCRPTLRELHLYFWRHDTVPLLTKHLTLQHLALDGPTEVVILVLARLPIFAPSSLVGIWIDPYLVTLKDSEKASESQWKAVDLALCDAKFPHLKTVEFSGLSEEPLQNPHAFFRQALPKSYERGILWLRRGHGGQPTRVAPVGAPKYPGLPLEREDFHYP